MRIHIVSPPSTSLLSLIDGIQARGNIVSHSDQVPPDADFYLFCTGHEAMKHLNHGWVCLDLRNDPEMDAASWSPYADLCIVHSSSDQVTLVESQGCEQERVYVVPGEDRLLDLLDKVRDNSLAPAEIPESSRPGSLPSGTQTEVTMTDPQRWSQPKSTANAPSIAELTARLEVAERQTDVMLRNFQVQSKVPLVGPFIVWLRRNLTSHLREPYLDPTLEQQVALNRDLVNALQQVSALLAKLEGRVSKLEERRDHD